MFNLIIFLSVFIFASHLDVHVSNQTPLKANQSQKLGIKAAGSHRTHQFYQNN